MFRVYDANDDGYVDFVEFMVRIPSWKRKYWIFYDIQMIFYIMSDGSPEEVLAKIFRVFDVNRWPDHQQFERNLRNAANKPLLGPYAGI